ncbi:MAG: GAF domain-containing protein, partial [Thermoanaerobaculia bacterium]|nr:GAF domain-containing protein [Thermoanaerobaculia bacterium]
MMTGGTGERPESAASELEERARALRCLYRIDEILGRRDITTDELVRALLAAIPEGFTHPEVCGTRARLRDRRFASSDFVPTPWLLTVPLVVQGETTGELEVYYTEPRAQRDQGPFLDEERRLLETIAEHLASVLARRRL